MKFKVLKISKLKHEQNLKIRYKSTGIRMASDISSIALDVREQGIDAFNYQ